MSKPYESRDEQLRYPSTRKADLAFDVVLAGIGLATVIAFVLTITWSLT